MDPDPHALRPWQTIAKELVAEKDPKKVLDLSEELTQALDQQSHTSLPDARKAG